MTRGKTVQEVDRMMDAGPPESMPEELRNAIPKRTFAGVFEVVDTDGQLAPSS